MNTLLFISDSLTAPPRLSRSQLAQKVGARGHYPRRSGPLVPARLSEIVCAAQLPGAAAGAPPSDEGRRQMGREVVRIVSRSLRHLPQAVLETAMPHPRDALWLPLEDRTRNVIERLLPIIAKQRDWTIARYLAIPQFGARCLVDLLAALDEDEAARSRAAAG